MVLMIDNYDSFTYNLVQYLAELGAQVRVVRNDEISVDEVRSLAPRAIVISPGPSAPDQAGISLELVQYLAGRVPIFGVCLGHHLARAERSAARRHLARAHRAARRTRADPRCLPRPPGDRTGIRRQGGAREARHARQGVGRAP